MTLQQVLAGNNIPEDIYVIIEIPAHSSPIKYEIDKETGVVFVDRFISTPMFYPCNYGYINNTLSLDGDAIDVLVPTPYPLLIGSVINCKPIGMLDMIDEEGEDYKIIAVPNNKISNQYHLIQDIDQCPTFLREQICYFFQHYKDLTANKWVTIREWKNADSAKTEILNAYQRSIIKNKRHQLK
ncbi:inorganic pyrophosphatase [Candidatus Blochmanniella vafra str. BVAF]|uniref:Inorganic pyrophosphatase n=1 Tax=Blochmanniella vafra (strain BVAF) TaxID=859654 RepID=E8Q6Q9_BLOVB|nr:inorganic diphosphatase [Candidatus Blochmannia vafer]ADV33500.1 inorganic pyrophosphatase [Candidatus Blochmannia vafer str. BVAF]